LHQNLWEDYYEDPQKKSKYKNIKKYIETKEDYNTICGYKFKHLDKDISVYIRKENTTDALWEQLKELLKKYNFPGYYYDIELLINKNPIFEESIILNHPLYSCISSICVFNSGYFFYPNKIIKSEKSSQTLDLNKNFNPKNFLKFYTEYMTIINDMIIDYKADKIKLKKIIKLLDNPEYSKEDINEELNSKEFINETNKIIEKMKKEMPPLILFPGVIPRLRKHDDIFTRYLLELDLADKPNKISIDRIIETYPMVLDKKDGCSYIDLGGLYNCGHSTAQERVNYFCEFVNINKPN